MAETLTQVRARRLEKSARLQELAGEEDLDEAGEAEFSQVQADVKALTKREGAMVAAGADEPEVVATGSTADDKEVAEFAKLVDEASMGAVLDAVCFGRRVAGATAELQQEVGVDVNVIPLELFANSTVTAGGNTETQEATVGQVFPSPLSMAMGIDRRSVGVGPTNVPVVTAPTGAVQAVTAIGTAVVDETVTITGEHLSPKRLQVGATIGRDELSSFVGLEDDVEMTLREALMSGLDRQALYATGSEGLLTHGNAPAADAVVETFASIWGDVSGAIDGRYASRLADLSVVVGPATYRLGTTLYRDAAGDAETVIEKLDRVTAGVMTTAHVADPAADDQQAVIARGGAMHTGQAQRMWGGVEVIRDPYTLAAEGQIRLSLVLMQATAMVRTAVYKRVAFHLA